jgi:hypothetical protein
VLVASSKTLPLALTILTILPAALGDKGLIALPCILGHFSQVPRPLAIIFGPLPPLFPPRALGGCRDAMLLLLLLLMMMMMILLTAPTTNAQICVSRSLQPLSRDALWLAFCA